VIAGGPFVFHNRHERAGLMSCLQRVG